jgi:hypothetical protein
MIEIEMLFTFIGTSSKGRWGHKVNANEKPPEEFVVFENFSQLQF